MFVARAAARVAAAVALVGLHRVDAQTVEETDWTDVCIAEDLSKYRDTLCKATFFVSALAFNPLAPEVVSTVTLVLQPSLTIPKDEWLARKQYVDLDLPGFEPVGTVNLGMATKRDLRLRAKNPLDVTVPPDEGYNTVVNPLFEPFAVYNTKNGILRLTIIKGKQMLPDIDTEVEICCVRLPNSSPKDNPKYRIAAPTSEDDTQQSVFDEQIKSVPEIDPGFQFQFLQVMFDPPVSLQLCVVSLTLRSANDLKDRQQIILYMPQIRRVDDVDGVMGFSTTGSANPLDWMLFASEAIWNNTVHSLAFYLREGQVLNAGRQITLRTLPGDFRLPVSIEPNTNEILVEARSLDAIDQIIAKTPIDQSTNVPPIRTFLESELLYEVAKPNVQTDVTFRFRTNRPMFVGTAIYIRLSGFTSEVMEVPLIGPTGMHFADRKGRFDIPGNLMVLNMTKTMYCNEQVEEIIFQGMFLPPALYKDDASLLIWTSDPNSERQSVATSPELCHPPKCGGEQKTFVRSQIAFDPAEPRLPSNVTVTILPSIFFYQEDSIVLHLYGFVCPTTSVALAGPGASKIDREMARWYSEDYMLVLTIGKNQVIDNVEPFIVTITRDQNFRLPGLLSKNDGTLRIEGIGATIVERPLLKVPAMGDPKLVIKSRVDIEPSERNLWDPSRPYATVVITFILNTDVLPNSTVLIKLGGLMRNPMEIRETAIGKSEGRSGEVVLSGKNAPLFYGVGQWNHDKCELSLKTKPLYIYAGEEIRFFLETDMYFQLPYASYSNDPAFRIAIQGAGIAEQQFLYSTKWVDREKTFDITYLYYGDEEGQVFYPGEAPDFNFKFRPNVNLPAGTVITLSLPGFVHSSETVILSAPETAISNEYDISGFIPTADWDQIKQELRVTVPAGNAIIPRLNVLRVQALGNAGFTLPITALAKDDPRLTIRCSGNQHIFVAPIKSSPRIVRRTFLVSKFEYRPPIKESIFLFIMRLQPAVNISYPDHILIELRGFRNSLSKSKIEITGPSRSYIKMAEGAWNESTEILTLPLIFRGDPIVADEMLEFHIEESQGFILPSKLQRNSPLIRITSLDNINWEPVKESPMVGNMPYSPHRFCMYQYQQAVQTRTPICHQAKDCEPPLTDPCNIGELERCGCDTRLDEQFNFTIEGFNLEDTDTMHFVPYETKCDINYVPLYLSAFTLQRNKPMISKEADSATFYDFKAMHTGYYRMCYLHAGTLFDIGFVSVRPNCEAPYVMVGGTCVRHCSRTKIPVAGECRTDPLAKSQSDSQALMVQIRMKDPEVAGDHLSLRDSQDQEVRYFEYRFIYELAKLLNCEPERIQVASLSKGSTLVNMILTAVGDRDVIKTTTKRSPLSLMSLLRALQSDTSSAMYLNTFFTDIDKPRSLDQIVSRSYDPPAVPVRLCSDDVYRVFCPYAGDILAAGTSYTIFLVGSLVVSALFSALMLGCWILDFDKGAAVNEIDLDQLRKDPSSVDKDKQLEYARSWLEGRFTGEQWQAHRRNSFLAIGD